MQPSSSAPPQRAARRFGAAWLATVAILAGVLFPGFTLVVLNWFNKQDLFWVDQLYQRKSHFLARRPPAHGSRLLIFGGSASIFGVDAELIEKDLGVPTVNFATHAALGLDYQISRIKRAAGKGDSVLLCPELEGYIETETPGEFPREYAFTYDRRYVLAMKPMVALECLFLSPPLDYADSIARWNGRLTGLTEEGPSKIHYGYSKIKLSPNGDLRGVYLDRNPLPEAFPQTFSAHAKASLAELNRWSRRHDVRLLLTWVNRMAPPPGDKDEFAIHKQVAQFCTEQGIPVVGTPEESIYPREMFIDSVYHLNEIGRRIRTEKLIGHLRELFGAKAPEGPKTVCLLGSRTPLDNETGIFERQESVEYKYLTGSLPGRPDCIAPGELRDLALSGVRVTCIDDATEAIAQKAGLRSQEIRRRETSLGDWIQHYDRHLFLLALVGTDRCPVTLEKPSKYFARFLSEQGFRVALIGTGPFKTVHHISSNPDAAGWSKRRYEPFSAPTFFNFRIALKSGPASLFDKTRPAIMVEGESLSALTPGLAVAVIDPDLGIVVAQGTFQGGRLLEWKLRELVIP